MLKIPKDSATSGTVSPAFIGNSMNSAPANKAKNSGKFRALKKKKGLQMANFK